MHCGALAQSSRLTFDLMKSSQPVEEMSVPSMRIELLDILAALFPEVTWRTRVPAREIAEFAISELSDHTSVQHGQRALGLAYAIRKRTRPVKGHS
jgi:hypothetical protein